MSAPLLLDFSGLASLLAPCPPSPIGQVSAGHTARRRQGGQPCRAPWPWWGLAVAQGRGQGRRRPCGRGPRTRGWLWGHSAQLWSQGRRCPDAHSLGPAPALVPRAQEVGHRPGRRLSGHACCSVWAEVSVYYSCHRCSVNVHKRPTVAHNELITSLVHTFIFLQITFFSFA